MAGTRPAYDAVAEPGAARRGLCGPISGLGRLVPLAGGGDEPPAMVAAAAAFVRADLCSRVTYRFVRRTGRTRGELCSRRYWFARHGFSEIRGTVFGLVRRWPRHETPDAEPRRALVEEARLLASVARRKRDDRRGGAAPGFSENPWDGVYDGSSARDSCAQLTPCLVSRFLAYARQAN